MRHSAAANPITNENTFPVTSAHPEMSNCMACTSPCLLLSAAVASALRSMRIRKPLLQANCTNEGAGGSVCGCMCVYTYTHTHTAQMGYSVVSPGVGMRHLEGPTNSDGLNLGIHIFVYVQTVHTCM